jgi:hypothetical protein
MPTQATMRTLNHRLRRLALRFSVAALILIVLLYCGLRVYTVYLTHRAVLLLDEATRVQIGATEGSMLPLIAHYGGVKQAPPSPEPTDDCPVTVDGVCLQLPPQSRADREYLNAHLPDYTYEVDLSPFNVFSERHQPSRGIHRAIAVSMFQTSIFLRNLFSLRNWDAFAYISIRAGRVEGVTSGLFVEGRTKWLGHSWHLSGDMPSTDMPQERYRAEAGFLELNTGGGITEHYLTPAATADQFQAARSINTHCLTGLIPCSDLPDLSPRAFEYKKLHPKADSNLE